MLVIPSLAFVLWTAPIAECQDDWAAVAADLRERLGVARTLPEEPGDAALRERLAGMTVQGLAFEDEESLDAILAAVRTTTGLPIVAGARAQDVVLDEGVRFDLTLRAPLSVARLLDLVTELAGHDVTWTVRDGIAIVTTLQDARAELHAFLHPVADLYDVFDRDDLATLVYENVAPGTWEEERVGLEPVGAFLLVTQTRGVQLDVERFLGTLREFRASLGAPPTFQPTPAERAVEAALAQLEAVRVAPGFQGSVSIEEFATFVGEVAGRTVVLDHRLVEDRGPLSFGVEGLLPVEVSVPRLLDLVVRRSGVLRWSVADGILRLEATDQPPAGLHLALYDVRAIVEPLSPSDAPPHCGSGDELVPRVLPVDRLEELLRVQIDPYSWDSWPECSIRITDTGILLVRQTPANQAQVRRLVASLDAIARVMMEAEGH